MRWVWITASPLFGRHVEDHAVAQDAGDVDEDVELAEVVERHLDDALARVHLADVLETGDGVAALALDLVDDFLGRAGFTAAAVHVHAGVDDDDLGALGRHVDGDAAADAASGAGDDSCLTFEPSSWHIVSSL